MYDEAPPTQFANATRSGEPVGGWIGVFDSGIGGLSVLTQVLALLPEWSIQYVADQRFAPYGERSLAEVADRAVQISGQLIETGVDVVVVACNSASAAALHRLRWTYPDTPFVGMEPAVKPAALQTTSGVIGVLATSATFQGELFASVVDRHSAGVEVIPIVGAGLAALVEEGREHGAEAKELLRTYLTPALDAGMDTLVLGCTHYSFLRDTIATIGGERLTVIDPAPAVARRVRNIVDATGRAASGGRRAAFRLATTAPPAALRARAAALLGRDDLDVARW